MTAIENLPDSALNVTHEAPEVSAEREVMNDLRDQGYSPEQLEAALVLTRSMITLEGTRVDARREMDRWDEDSYNYALSAADQVIRTVLDLGVASEKPVIRGDMSRHMVPLHDRVAYTLGISGALRQLYKSDNPQGMLDCLGRAAFLTTRAINNHDLGDGQFDHSLQFGTSERMPYTGKQINILDKQPAVKLTKPAVVATVSAGDYLRTAVERKHLTMNLLRQVRTGSNKEIAIEAGYEPHDTPLAHLNTLTAQLAYIEQRSFTVPIEPESVLAQDPIDRDSPEYEQLIQEITLPITKQLYQMAEGSSRLRVGLQYWPDGHAFHEDLAVLIHDNYNTLEDAQANVDHIRQAAMQALWEVGGDMDRLQLAYALSQTMLHPEEYPTVSLHALRETQPRYYQQLLDAAGQLVQPILDKAKQDGSPIRNIVIHDRASHDRSLLARVAQTLHVSGVITEIATPASLETNAFHLSQAILVSISQPKPPVDPWEHVAEHDYTAEASDHAQARKESARLAEASDKPKTVGAFVADETPYIVDEVASEDDKPTQKVRIAIPRLGHVASSSVNPSVWNYDYIPEDTFAAADMPTRAIAQPAYVTHAYGRPPAVRVDQPAQQRPAARRGYSAAAGKMPVMRSGWKRPEGRR